MVSKVAVIALVAIVACPILLGYGLNLSEVTVIDYEGSNDTVNVTPLLQSGTEYSTARGDLYQLNTRFETSVSGYPAYPSFNKTNLSVNTSLPMRTGIDSNWSGETQNLTYCVEYTAMFKYSYSAGSYIVAKVYSGGTLLATIDHIYYVHYVKETDKIEYAVMTGVNSIFENAISGGNYTQIIYSSTGGQTATRYWDILYNDNRAFTDISGGFYFNIDITHEGPSYKILMPDKTFSTIISINLDSISASSYTATVGGFTFTKTTTGGQVNWNVSRSWWDGGHYETYSQDLYYNPDISNNTYQMIIKYPDESETSTDPTYPDPTYRHYHRSVEFRYIGTWSQLIGEANYYQNYTCDYWEYKRPAQSYLSGIGVAYPANGRSFTLRVDAADFQAFEYPVIEDNTYQPSSFRSNPETTISNVQKAGTQLVFGGNTYQVRNGNIMIGTHSIPVEGLVLSSVPNGAGTYDNKIGNTVVSTSADPSTITFTGKWNANIATVSSQQITYTKTEWTPGQFGWNGLDQNFLMVGLLTSIGVFIALGIYIRRTKAALWPLLIVCGGAAVLFFVML